MVQRVLTPSLSGPTTKKKQFFLCASSLTRQILFQRQTEEYREIMFTCYTSEYIFYYIVYCLFYCSKMLILLWAATFPRNSEKRYFSVSELYLHNNMLQRIEAEKNYFLWKLENKLDNIESHSGKFARKTEISFCSYIFLNVYLYIEYIFSFGYIPLRLCFWWVEFGWC